MEIGIVGLPNVGKSTLFNALLKKQAALAANYPFATIEPNVGVVEVPDPRLDKLAEVLASTVNPSTKLRTSRPPIKPAVVRFVDIAGLVAGASKGEGLGNKFLSHIREVDAIVYLLRDFSDENVIRAGSENPQADYEVLESELMLADLESAIKAQDTKNSEIKFLGSRIVEQLEKGMPVRTMKFSEEEEKLVKQMNFLTSKPVIKVLNVDESQLMAGSSQSIVGEVRICAKLESELSELTQEEQKAYLADLGLENSGLDRLIAKAFNILGLSTFLTAGEKEVRAWTIKKGSTAPEAAGAIHTDFEKHFIKADVINFEDFVSLGGWSAAREVGKVRLEGREYIMQENDVVEFRIGI